MRWSPLILILIIPLCGCTRPVSLPKALTAEVTPLLAERDWSIVYEGYIEKKLRSMDNQTSTFIFRDGASFDVPVSLLLGGQSCRPGWYGRLEEKAGRYRLTPIAVEVFERPARS